MKKFILIIGLFVIAFLFVTCKKDTTLPPSTVNNPPKITEIQVSPAEIVTNSNVTLTALATDPEGDNLDYTWKSLSGSFISTTGQSVQWTTPSSAGSVEITLTVSDGVNTKTLTKSINIQAATGSLSVTSTPSGANIYMDGIDTKKITPYNFNNLPVGIKIISVIKTGYITNKDTISAKIQYKKLSTVSFTLTALANISGYVFYSGTKIPVSGATVSISNKTFTTSSTGSYNISEIASGNTLLVATKPDYDPFSKSITLISGNNKLDIEMTSGIYTSTIKGSVKTSIGTIIPGVIVSLLNEDNTSTNIHDLTDASGNYQLPSVPQGQRKLSFSIASFDDNQKAIFVSDASRVFDIILSAKLITPFNPTTENDVPNRSKIKWSGTYGPELLGFNIYRASSFSASYVKINTNLITLSTNPPANGFIYYIDQTYDSFIDNYYKITVVNVDSYEGPLSDLTQIMHTISVGDTYQGGKIAYFLQPTDPGYVPGQPHGLITAPDDQSNGILWSNGNWSFLGITETKIGSGSSNTNSIVSILGEGDYAAKLCYDLVLGGYSDWYLPSKDELRAIQNNRNIIGLGVSYYWSSSEVNDISAWWGINGYINYANNGLSKGGTLYVRAVRSF